MKFFLNYEFQYPSFKLYFLSRLMQISVQGFTHCRPVISIDGTYLYEKFEGKMLIATGIDAENGIFSLAYAIVDEETTVSWS